MQAASHGGTPLAECFSGMDVSHKRAVFGRRSGLSVCAGSSVSIGLSCALFRCLKGRTMSWGCHRLASQSGFAFPDRALRFSLSQSWEGNPPHVCHCGLIGIFPQLDLSTTLKGHVIMCRFYGSDVYHDSRCRAR